MSTTVKKLTNKRLTNIGTQRRQADVATFCCGKCNKLRFLRDEGWGTVRVSGVHKTCDPHRARQAVRLARPSGGRGLTMKPVKSFIEGMPKAELHLHIEGTLEPELMFELALRNGVGLPFDSPDEVRRAYAFSDLQSFLDIYYQGSRVLRRDRDFFDVTWAYLRK